MAAVISSNDILDDIRRKLDEANNNLKKEAESGSLAHENAMDSVNVQDEKDSIEDDINLEEDDFDEVVLQEEENEYSPVNPDAEALKRVGEDINTELDKHKALENARDEEWDTLEEETDEDDHVSEDDSKETDFHEEEKDSTYLNKEQKEKDIDPEEDRSQLDEAPTSGELEEEEEAEEGGKPIEDDYYEDYTPERKKVEEDAGITHDHSLESLQPIDDIPLIDEQNEDVKENDLNDESKLSQAFLGKLSPSDTKIKEDSTPISKDIKDDVSHDNKDNNSKEFRSQVLQHKVASENSVVEQFKRPNYSNYELEAGEDKRNEFAEKVAKIVTDKLLKLQTIKTSSNPPSIEKPPETIHDIVNESINMAVEKWFDKNQDLIVNIIEKVSEKILSEIMENKKN